jgi:hypothetical protein
VRTDPNILAAWLGIAAGVISGALIGLAFGREGFLGGYASWPRRMIRLGHIAFFGIALLNLAYATTVHALKWSSPPVQCSLALAAANGLMPAVCFLSAWKKSFRHLFVVPVACVLIPVAGVIYFRN